MERRERAAREHAGIVERGGRGHSTTPHAGVMYESHIAGQAYGERCVTERIVAKAREIQQRHGDAAARSDDASSALTQANVVLSGAFGRFADELERELDSEVTKV